VRRRELPERIELTMREYERVRGDPARFDPRSRRKAPE
jgi:hypothetical protein